MRNLMITLLLIVLSGCSTLGVQKNFDDSIKEIKQRGNYAQIISKVYNPNMTALKGTIPTKGKLYIVASSPKQINTKGPSSVIKLEVTYIKNYSEFANYTLNGHSQNVINEFPTFESCSDLCMNIQYLQLPISNEYLQLAAKKGLSFTLSSSNKSIVTQFDIPAGYIKAVTNQFINEPFKNIAIEPSSSITDNNLPSNLAEEMVKYWFNQVPPEARKSTLAWLLNQ